MEIKLLEIRLAPRESWITLFNFEIGDQDRSFLHVEKSEGVWKFQLFWLNNKCWTIGI